MNLNQEQKKVIRLSSFGGLLEFYDFTIYGLFSVYFAAQFFPSQNAFSSIIASYSVFVIGYIARPLGGIIFSHLGDALGRKMVLMVTMILMGVASLGVGVLPTYPSIGILAPIGMVILRLIQGLALGGELPSTIVYVSESIPMQRGIAIGTIFAATVSGLLLGMVLNLLIIHIFTTEQIANFGWRIPFLLGGILCFVAYKVRCQLHETLAFQHLKQHDRFPLNELIRHHFSSLLIGIGLVGMLATPIMLALIFMPTYLTQLLGFSTEEASNAILCATVFSIIAIYSMGLLTTRFSPYRLLQYGIGTLLLSAALCYFMLYKGISPLWALLLFAINQGAMVSLPLILLTDLFPTHIRLTGVALSYNLAFVLLGAVSPIVITALSEYTQRIYSIPVIWIVLSSFISLLALIYYKKRPLYSSAD